MFGFECLGPSIPGVQTGASTVQKNDGFRVIPWSFVPQMHVHAINGDKLGRLLRPARRQILYRTIRRPHSDHANYQERDQGKQQISDNFSHMVGLFGEDSGLSGLSSGPRLGIA